MPETAENVTQQFGIERGAQDRMALASQRKAVAAQQGGVFDAEITPVSIAQKKGDAIVVTQDEHPRARPCSRPWQGSRAWCGPMAR